MNRLIVRLLPVILGIIGSFFIGWFHLQRMLSKSHYQYLVFLPLMIWAASRSRHVRRVADLPEGFASNIGISLFAILLCLASIAWSPWIAVAAILGSAFFYCLGTFSKKSFFEWLPIWLLAGFILPIPFGWDEQITLKLRGIATVATSQLLDFIGVLHVQYSNVIEVPGKKLFIADACSGVHSLYVLIAASMFWGILHRRRMLHLVCLLIIAAAVVLFENIVRLVTVATGIRWQLDLSEGTDHQVLGGVLFVVSVAILLLVDRFLLFFFPSRKSMIKSDSTPQTSRADYSQATIGFNILNGLMFLAAAAIQSQSMPGPLPNLLSNFQGPDELRLLSEATFPETIAGLTRDSFRYVKRVPGDPFGQQSQQWSFSDDTGLFVQVSIDYPFDGFHDSTVCYSQVGWMIDSATTVDDAGAPYAIVQMNQKLEGDALLIFCQIDQQGTVHARLKNQSTQLSGTSIVNRIRSLLSRETRSNEQPAVLPLVQFQLLARSSFKMTDADLNRIEKLFIEFRKTASQELGIPIAVKP